MKEHDKINNYYHGDLNVINVHFVHLIISKVFIQKISEHDHKEIQYIKENTIHGYSEISQ